MLESLEAGAAERQIPDLVRLRQPRVQEADQMRLARLLTEDFLEPAIGTQHTSTIAGSSYIVLSINIRTLGIRRHFVPIRISCLEA